MAVYDVQTSPTPARFVHGPLLDPHLDRAITRISSAPLRTGNTLTLLRNGPATFDDWLGAIANARRWVHLVAGACAIAFYAISILLCWQVAEAMQFQPMVVIDWPLSYVYWAILAGLVLTTFRATVAAWKRFRAGEPEAPPDPSLGVQL